LRKSWAEGGSTYVQWSSSNYPPNPAYTPPLEPSLAWGTYTPP